MARTGLSIEIGGNIIGFVQVVGIWHLVFRTTHDLVGVFNLSQSFYIAVSKTSAGRNCLRCWTYYPTIIVLREEDRSYLALELKRAGRLVD